MDHKHSDDGAVALACFFLTIILVLMFYIATPAKSQEAPGMPCGPAEKVQAELQTKYGEVIVGGGFVNNDILVITTNPRSGSFTILVRRPDGKACLLLGGEGFAMADPAQMHGDGM